MGSRVIFCYFSFADALQAVILVCFALETGLNINGFPGLCGIESSMGGGKSHGIFADPQPGAPGPMTVEKQSTWTDDR